MDRDGRVTFEAPGMTADWMPAFDSDRSKSGE